MLDEGNRVEIIPTILHGPMDAATKSKFICLGQGILNMLERTVVGNDPRASVEEDGEGCVRCRSGNASEDTIPTFGKIPLEQ